jgi:hypothetical protein
MKKQTHLTFVNAELSGFRRGADGSTLQTHHDYEFAKTNPLPGIAEQRLEPAKYLCSHHPSFGQTQKQSHYRFRRTNGVTC